MSKLTKPVDAPAAQFKTGDHVINEPFLRNNVSMAHQVVTWVAFCPTRKEWGFGTRIGHSTYSSAWESELRAQNGGVQ